MHNPSENNYYSTTVSGYMCAHNSTAEGYKMGKFRFAFELLQKKDSVLQYADSDSDNRFNFELKDSFDKS